MNEMLRMTAESAARAGAAELLRHVGNITDLRTKSGARDLVSAADIGSGVAVARAISESLEGARFVVEEPEVYDLAGVAQGSLSEDAVWVIDPLDGTTSFVHGYPCWSVSVAYLECGMPMAGAVYDVPSDVLYSAASNAGSTANGVPLACSGAGTLDEALIVTGFPYDRTVTLDRQLILLERVIRRAHDVRRDGSAAIDLCRVATNAVDGFWELGLKCWDMAAGVLVLTESGATVTSLDGSPWSIETADVLAANPVLHAELVTLLAETGTNQ